MRVFNVQGPNRIFFAPAPPQHPELAQIVLSTNAYVKEDASDSYKEFCRAAQKYLIRVDSSYMNDGAKGEETSFYKRVRIKGSVYMKVPLFFPFFARFTCANICDKRRRPDICSTQFQVKPGFSLYDYQEKVMEHILPQLRSPPYYSATLQAECGAGKTGMTCYLIAQLQVRTIIFVNTQHLMNQWVCELKSWLGLDEVEDIGYIGGGHTPPAKTYPVLICMLQSLRDGVAGKQTFDQYIDQYDLLVSDECHHMAADTYYQTMSHFKGRYRLALSATLERSDDMIRLVPYLFGPVACWVEEDLERSTYTKYLHPLYYSNPEHADQPTLRQWNPNRRPKLNYGLMQSRTADDLNRSRLAVQYALSTFGTQRVLYLSKLRHRAEYVATYLQYREHAAFWWHAFTTKFSVHLPQKIWHTFCKMSHRISALEEAARQRIKERMEKKKKSKKRKDKKDKKVRKVRKKKLHPPKNTQVFLYMGGGASSKPKRLYRDQMLETATHLSCTVAIAGEAFNVRDVHVLVILDAQKPGGLLTQLVGRIKRGKHVDRVDVVTMIDHDNPTFERTGAKQICWFRKQRFFVFEPLKLHVDMERAPASTYTLDRRSQRLLKNGGNSSAKQPKCRQMTLRDVFGTK